MTEFMTELWAIPFLCVFSHSDDGSCKHVVALLFAIEDFTNRRLDKGTSVGTDKPCEWTKPRRTSVPVKVEELDYRWNKTTPKKPGPTPKDYTPMKDIGPNVILKIQQDLKKVSLLFNFLFLLSLTRGVFQ